MTAKHVNSEDFAREVLQAERPTLVDFYADWCGPCRQVGPAIEELASEVQTTAQVVKVNVDDAPDIASKYGVQSIPTFVVFQNGEVKTKLVGVHSKAVLTDALAN